MVMRKTQRTRMIRKLKELRREMKLRRHASLPAQRKWLAAVLRGHYGYFGITGNGRSLACFHIQIVKWWRWVLRRRGQRPKLPWERFNASWSASHFHGRGSCITGATRLLDRDTRWNCPVRESRTLGSVRGRRAIVASTRPPNFGKPLIYINLRRNSKRRGTTLGAALAFWGGFWKGLGLRRGGLSGSRRQRDMGLAEQSGDCPRRVGAQHPIGAAILEARLLQPIEIAQQLLPFRRDARLVGKIVEIFFAW